MLLGKIELSWISPKTLEKNIFMLREDDMAKKITTFQILNIGVQLYFH